MKFLFYDAYFTNRFADNEMYIDEETCFIRHLAVDGII